MSTEKDLSIKIAKFKKLSHYYNNEVFQKKAQSQNVADQADKYILNIFDKIYDIVNESNTTTDAIAKLTELPKSFVIGSDAILKKEMQEFLVKEINDKVVVLINLLRKNDPTENNKPNIGKLKPTAQSEIDNIRNAFNQKFLGKTDTTEKVTEKASSNRDLVASVQKALMHEGFDPGKIDGIFGDNTIAAMQAFQSKKGLRETNSLNQETLKAITTDMQKLIDNIEKYFTKTR